MPKGWTVLSTPLLTGAGVLGSAFELGACFAGGAGVGGVTERRAGPIGLLERLETRRPDFALCRLCTRLSGFFAPCAAWDTGPILAVCEITKFTCWAGRFVDRAALVACPCWRRREDTDEPLLTDLLCVTCLAFFDGGAFDTDPFTRAQGQTKTACWTGVALVWITLKMTDGR